MSAPPLPPGAQRLTRLAECISDVDAAVDQLREELPSVNEPGLRRRVLALVEASGTILSVYRTQLGPDVADRVNDLLRGVQELAVPARDSDLGPTPTLVRIEQATGLVAIRLIKTLEATAALGWRPKQPQLPEGLTASVQRQELGSLLDRIAARLDALGESLDRLVLTNDSVNGFPQQRGLLNFYVGSVRVEINLARMQLMIGETSVDVAALWRASETIVELTGDLISTLRAWGRRVSVPVLEAAQAVGQRVRMIVSSVSRVIRFVARRRRAKGGGLSGSDPFDRASEAGNAAADPSEKLKWQIRNALMARINPSAAAHIPRAALRAEVAKLVSEIATEHRFVLNEIEERAIASELTDEMIGLGPLEPFLHDDDVTSIVATGPFEIHVERHGQWEKTPARFRDSQHFVNVMQRILIPRGGRLDEANPIGDAWLADGSRVYVALMPNGGTISISKFRGTPEDDRAPACP
jgi:hypothetical protein